MIKSKIHHNWYIWLTIMIFLMFFGFVMYIFNSILYAIENGINISDILIIVFFIFLEIFLIIVVKDFKYIIIDKQGNLKYYSILTPFGHTLKLDDFDNKIKTSETSVRGEYKVVYLVKKGYTAFKISGLFYDNLKEMDSSIQLKRIYNYKFNLKLYLQLLFTGKIKIEAE
ncbi:hypothetical protein [Chryseobacterium gleum]|uniref:hypothetical protein n=1 Tax=Chryseobacterium gleum TaxID=250 RepID=UPI0031DBAA27